MKRIPLLLIALLLAACGTDSLQPATAASASASTLNIFAAASLSESFRELASRFEAAHPEITVSLNFAGSNTLRAQIEQGAQADLFASANLNEMETLQAQGLINGFQPFAENRLVVITPAENTGALSQFADLANPGLKLVLAAEEVPAGNYSRQVLARLGEEFERKTLANLVSNENSVRQVLAKIQLGEADAGIVYASDLFAAEQVTVIEIPAEVNVSAVYALTQPLGARHPEAAQAFIDFLLSAEGQEILAKWGFLPLDEHTQ